MRLTDQQCWRYDTVLISRRAIETVRRRDEWLTVIRRTLPGGALCYLELGCAPGLYTAALAEGTQWDIFGIDYSDDAELFIETLSIVGKQARLHRADMFNQRIDGRFDIVCSFGLVEHFRGSSFDEILRLHDSYVEAGGYVVIQMPNFTDFQYIWHYFFDRPDLDNHNIDVMQPAAMQWFEESGYEIICNDYVGVMRLWGNSGWLRYRVLGKVVAGMTVGLSKVARFLNAIGIRLHGRTWSPDFLMIARKRGLS